MVKGHVLLCDSLEDLQLMSRMKKWSEPMAYSSNIGKARFGLKLPADQY